MNALELLRQSAAQTTRIANAIMANPHATPDEFTEAFRARDIATVESMGYDAEQLAEIRWETGCGCNGNDSPFHTYFGFESASDRYQDEGYTGFEASDAMQEKWDWEERRLPAIAEHFHASDAEFRGDELWLENCDCPNTGYQAGWSKSMYSKAFALSMINR